jgi:hypothetical protein
MTVTSQMVDRSWDVVVATPALAFLADALCTANANSNCMYALCERIRRLHIEHMANMAHAALRQRYS